MPTTSRVRAGHAATAASEAGTGTAPRLRVELGLVTLKRPFLPVDFPQIVSLVGPKRKGPPPSVDVGDLINSAFCRVSFKLWRGTFACNSSGQGIEHYKITCETSLAVAQPLGDKEVAAFLTQILKEEKETDHALSRRAAAGAKRVDEAAHHGRGRRRWLVSAQPHLTGEQLIGIFAGCA